jgi:hypothetical protein
LVTRASGLSPPRSSRHFLQTPFSSNIFTNPTFQIFSGMESKEEVIKLTLGLWYGATSIEFLFYHLITLISSGRS